MAIDRDDEERAARIDMLLEQFRVNTEDLQELIKRVGARALNVRAEMKALRVAARERKDRKASDKKH